MQDLIDILTAMGRWAQAARRGGLGATPRASLPPPAPTINYIEGEYYTASNSGDNTGGKLQLWTSDTEEGVKTLDEQRDWILLDNWGEGEYLPRKFLWWNELGNEVSWTGEGVFADVIDNTEG